MNFFLFIGLLVVGYAAIVWAVMKVEKKKVEVFTVSWDELRGTLGDYFGPGEWGFVDEFLASDKLVAELDKLEKADRDKVLEDLDPRYPVLKAVELTNHGVEFTFCHTKKTKEAQPTELAELKAKLARACDELIASYKRDEISVLEFHEQSKKLDDATGIKVKTLDENSIFWFFGSSFGLKAWRMPSSWPEGWGDHRPAISRKITKVELTNDGVQFTTIRV